MLRVAPSGMASQALRARLMRACWSSLGAPLTATSVGMAASSLMLGSMVWCNRSKRPSTSKSISTAVRLTSLPCPMASTRLESPAALAAASIAVRIISCGSPRWSTTASLRLAWITVSRLLKSCEIPAAKVPTESMRWA